MIKIMKTQIVLKVVETIKKRQPQVKPQRLRKGLIMTKRPKRSRKINSRKNSKRSKKPKRDKGKKRQNSN